jgi:hypothetical protein
LIYLGKALLSNDLCSSWSSDLLLLLGLRFINLLTLGLGLLLIDLLRSWTVNIGKGLQKLLPQPLKWRITPSSLFVEALVVHFLNVFVSHFQSVLVVGSPVTSWLCLKVQLALILALNLHALGSIWVQTGYLHFLDVDIFALHKFGNLVLPFVCILALFVINASLG